MARRFAYQGTKFLIAYAREKSGDNPGYDFFENLDRVEQAKLSALFIILGDHGNFYNKEKFGDLGEGLYEFESFQIRMPFAYAKAERKLILITHEFTKKRDKTPKEEIARARRILEED